MRRTGHGKTAPSVPRRIARQAPALVVLGLLSACGTIDPVLGPQAMTSPVAWTVPAEEHPSLFEPVPRGRALALAPKEVGDVVSVTERRQSDAQRQVTVVQRIVLAGDAATHGENAIEVNLKPIYGHDLARRLTEEEFAEELERRMPERSMAASTRLIGNGVGAFTLAEGVFGAEKCVFGMQRTTISAGPSLLNGQSTQATTIVRVCRGDRSLPELEEAVTRVSLRVPSGYAVASDATYRQTRQSGDALVAAGSTDAAVPVRERERPVQPRVVYVERPAPAVAPVTPTAPRSTVALAVATPVIVPDVPVTAPAQSGTTVPPP